MVCIKRVSALHSEGSLRAIGDGARPPGRAPVARTLTEGMITAATGVGAVRRDSCLWAGGLHFIWAKIPAWLRQRRRGNCGAARFRRNHPSSLARISSPESSAKLKDFGGVEHMSPASAWISNKPFGPGILAQNAREIWQTTPDSSRKVIRMRQIVKNILREITEWIESVIS